MWHVTVWIAGTRACESGVPAANAEGVQILRIRHKKVCRNPRLCKTANATGFRVTLSVTVSNSVTARKDERQQADGRSRMTLAPDCATEFKARLPDQGFSVQQVSCGLEINPVCRLGWKTGIDRYLTAHECSTSALGDNNECGAKVRCFPQSDDNEKALHGRLAEWFIAPVC